MAKVIVLGDDDDENSGNTENNGQTTHHKHCKCKQGAGKCGQNFTTRNANDKICSACIVGVHNH